MVLKENRQINELVIIFVGNFNPVIIQPFWLTYKNLIREEEGLNAKVEVIHNELVKFEIGGWLNIQVTKARLELRTTQEPYFEPLKDLAIDIIKILNETPLDSFGLNHIRHYILESDKQYFDFGNKIAPLNNWNFIMKDPRLLTLELLMNKPENGSVRIRVQPSDSLKNTKNAIMTNINDHFTIDIVGPKRNDQLLKLLTDKWRDSFTLADEAELNIEKIIKS
jgi:hypothetical protein